MENLNQRFEERLKELENGTPLEQILRSLSPDEAELAPLLNLAERTRRVEHPALAASKMDTQRSRVVREARLNQPQAKSPARRFSWRMASVGFAALVVLALLGVFGVVVALAGPAGANTATLADVQGVAEIASPGHADEWQPVADGAKVQAGSAIRTRADSSASLVFYDGSRTTLGSSASLILKQVSGGWGKTLKVELQQTAGETSNNVVPFTSSASFFHVLTPAGTAAVHGTIFRVDVNPTDGARFAVDRGVVWVSGAEANVTLTAGQMTAVDPNGAPKPPAYEFLLQGKVEKINGDAWTVAGTSFKVPAALQTADIRAGDMVSVRGHILADGSYLADRIERTFTDQLLLRFNGKVGAIGSDSWTIGEKQVLVNADTRIGAGIKLNDPVRVTVTVLPDGAWMAKEIESLLEEDKPETTPTSTLTAAPTATGTIETPTVTPTGTLTLTPEVTGTPEPEARCGTGDRQQPEGARLALRHNVPYAEIMSWFCQGYGFGEIDLAYDLSKSSHKPVTEIFDIRKSGQGWGQIKKLVEAAGTPMPAGSDKNKGNGKGPKK